MDYFYFHKNQFRKKFPFSKQDEKNHAFSNGISSSLKMVLVVIGGSLCIMLYENLNRTGLHVSSFNLPFFWPITDF